jgi:hypothetical protein
MVEKWPTAHTPQQPLSGAHDLNLFTLINEFDASQGKSIHA